MLSLRTPEGVFNLRVGVVIVGDGRVLLNRDMVGARHWFLPGGRGEFGETARDTALREVREELGVEGTVERLLWINENRWLWHGDVCHEIGFYFLVSLLGDVPVQEDVFTGPEGDRFEFRWHPVDDLEDLALYPEFLRVALRELPDAPKHVVEWELGSVPRPP